MSLLRWMRGNASRNRIENKYFCKKLGIADVEEKITENRLRLVQHLRRWSEDATVWKVESWVDENLRRS